VRESERLKRFSAPKIQGFSVWKPARSALFNAGSTVGPYQSVLVVDLIFFEKPFLRCFHFHFHLSSMSTSSGLFLSLSSPSPLLTYLSFCFSDRSSSSSSSSSSSPSSSIKLVSSEFKLPQSKRFFALKTELSQYLLPDLAFIVLTYEEVGFEDLELSEGLLRGLCVWCM
jgi:hypothetical protein